MPGHYSHTNRATGTVLTANIYNSDHQNHIDNHIPTMVDDYSTNAAQMQTVTDPGEVGSESLATSLAGEIERLRFMIKDVTGKTYWYESPVKTIAGLNTDIATLDAAAIKKAIVDAAGDLIVGSANDTVVRLPIGAQGSVLTVDTADPLKVKWAPGGNMTIGLYYSLPTSVPFK